MRNFISLFLSNTNKLKIGKKKTTYLKSGSKDWYSIGEAVSGKQLRIASLWHNVSEPWYVNKAATASQFELQAKWIAASKPHWERNFLKKLWSYCSSATIAPPRIT